jgi:hypothetical protein
MNISPRYTDSDWKALNLANSCDWRVAVRILDDSLNARFFEAVEAFEGQEFSGFAVLALDCLLIETLQQFKEGVDETPHRKVQKYFTNFLTTPPFSSYFTKASVSTFYDISDAAFSIRPKLRRVQKSGGSDRSSLHL